MGIDVGVLFIIRHDDQLIGPALDTIIEVNDTLVVHASDAALLHAKDVFYG